MAGCIVVENHYKQQRTSHVKVHCREKGDIWNHIPAKPQGGPIHSSPGLNADKDIELYVDETNASTPIRMRFGYIKVYFEWKNGDSITFEGNYDTNTKTATIRVIDKSDPECNEHKKPKTVNVQVGGN